MPNTNAPAPKEVAALLVISDKILSGRTKDKNIGYIAQYLTPLGIDLTEVRVVGNEERAIVDAINALRHRYTYVFSTGGIGPTHDDITSDCVAKAFGVPIDVDPRALAILHEWLKATGAEMSEARMRMTRRPPPPQSSQARLADRRIDALSPMDQSRQDYGDRAGYDRYCAAVDGAVMPFILSTSRLVE
jgi:hypothetical protein